jgi:uncharacterized protein YndB with AHSA1/START domain
VREIVPAPPLPINGTTEVALPVERVWAIFADVERWPDWNACFRRASVDGGELREGATLRFAFNPIRRGLLYRLPARAEIVEAVPNDRVTWEVDAPGFHALHSYRFAALGPERSTFGSWEVAEGPTYRALRPFWLAHFRYVCRESLDGARGLR